MATNTEGEPDESYEPIPAPESDIEGEPDERLPDE
jgi:hypothetical protein